MDAVSLRPDGTFSPACLGLSPAWWWRFVALLDAAENAGLLVVGTQGLGGFKRLILGSVSRAVIHYAETPVLVVRP